jgi:hypothetical protein
MRSLLWLAAWHFHSSSSLISKRNALCQTVTKKLDTQKAIMQRAGEIEKVFLNHSLIHTNTQQADNDTLRPQIPPHRKTVLHAHIIIAGSQAASNPATTDILLFHTNQDYHLAWTRGTGLRITALNSQKDSWNHVSGMLG